MQRKHKWIIENFIAQESARYRLAIGFLYKKIYSQKSSVREIFFLLLLLEKGLYFYQSPAHKKRQGDAAVCAASSGPDPQLEQISSAPWRAGDDAGLPQLWDIGGLVFFFSAGKDFFKCFLIYDAKAVFILVLCFFSFFPFFSRFCFYLFISKFCPRCDFCK